MSGPETDTPSLPPAGWRRLVEISFVVVGAVIIFALMGLSVTDALLRSAFNAPIFGANDYAQVLLSFAVAISFPLCILAGRLIAIDTLLRKFPDGVQEILAWSSSLLGAGILGYLSYRAYFNGLDAADFGESTMLLQLPFGPSYFALAAGCAVSAILLLLERLIR